jgi:hypothetical protein
MLSDLDGLLWADFNTLATGGAFLAWYWVLTMIL